MNVNKREIQGLALYLNDFARSERDNRAAKLLLDLLRVYEVTHEMIHAKTHEHSRACYAELFDLIKGKQGE